MSAASAPAAGSALFVGRDEDDPLFLQVKEAEASVLEPYLGRSTYAQHGQRVVEGQRLTQAATDILLGWTRVAGVDGRQDHYYFRQLWDEKGAAAVEKFEPAGMTIYAQVCGYTLARAHARSGDALSIAGYVGGGHHDGARHGQLRRRLRRPERRRLPRLQGPDGRGPGAASELRSSPR